MLFKDYGFHGMKQSAKGKEPRGNAITKELFALTSLPFASSSASSFDAHLHLGNRIFDQVDRFAAMSALVGVCFVEIVSGALQRLERCLHVRLIRRGCVVVTTRVLNAGVDLPNRLINQTGRFGAMTAFIAR